MRYLPSCPLPMVLAMWLSGWLLVGALPGAAQSLPPEAPQALRQFDTDWTQHTIDLSTLKSGGPSKDQIPALDTPSFVSVDEAREWVSPQEPVIALEHDGVARAYPLQILTWHEIVNDRIGDTPVAVTFCPLCYSAIVFDRRLEEETLSFGVSGLLRHSDLVMYDRASESLWQQFTGEAIVGDRVGDTLTKIPSQIVSFDQFASAHPEAPVLSRDTGHDRPYGRNPYAGYDDVDTRPFMLDGPTDGRLPPMEKVVAVTVGDTHKAYRRATTKEKRVIHDTVAGRSLVLFHAPGAVSALDARSIHQSKAIGSTGVFDRRVNDRTLTFRYDENGRFTDDQTGSTWTVTGRAVAGSLQGTQLSPIDHGDYFAFAWFAFRPNGILYTADDS